MITPKIKYEDWHPEEIKYDTNDEFSVPTKILGSLEEDHCVVVQGPPGTGKSYSIAYIIGQYLSKGKTVCVSTMANKGLEELVTQPPLSEYLRKGKLHKTLLTADEAAHAKGLRKASKDMIVDEGEAIFSTNYKLSNLFSEDYSDYLPQYDLIVLEEVHKHI